VPEQMNHEGREAMPKGTIACLGPLINSNAEELCVCFGIAFVFAFLRVHRALRGLDVLSIVDQRGRAGQRAHNVVSLNMFCKRV
jgi:hypothetical protein